MLSSQSTLAKDPSLFPLCGIGTAVASGSPLSPAVDDATGAADFEALIADLNPDEAPVEPTTPDLGACCLPVLGLAFVPPPVALALEPELTAGAEGTSTGTDAADGEPGGRASFWAGRTDARADWTGRAGPHGLATGVGGENSGRIFSSPPANLPASAGPAALASEQATQTPRYAGLPAVALENRQAPALPPGIARLQALPAEAAPAVVPGQEDPAGLLSAAGLSSPGNSPQVPFRGAMPAKSDQPGDAARAALEGNGLAASAPVLARPDRVLPVQEKFAGADAGAASALQDPAGLRKKSFLSTDEELFGDRGRSLGTDSAKAVGAMPATSVQPPPTHPNSHYAVTSVAPAGEVLPEVTPPAEVADTFSTAHEAVEVVLHAVEHVASREQKSVQLKFAVAGEELAVRVEMRADEVRTTFRTDSAELRAALEHEWQQLAGASATTDRSIRLSPAVFAAAGESANAFAGDTSSRDRRAGTPRDEFALPVSGLRGRAVASVAQDTPPPVAAFPSWSVGTHRLHTLA